jgi:hypothetical protein
MTKDIERQCLLHDFTSVFTFTFLVIAKRAVGVVNNNLITYRNKPTRNGGLFCCRQNIK